MTTEKQRYACTAINSVAIELHNLADSKGVIHISIAKLDDITQELKREIRKD